MGSAASIASDEAASETADSEASTEDFYDADDADAASFVSARSGSNILRASSTGSVLSVPPFHLQAGDEDNVLELILISGASHGVVHQMDDQQQTALGGLVAYTLPSCPGPHQVSEGSSGASSGRMRVQPLLMRVYLEGWDAAALCIKQHLIALQVLGTHSSSGSGQGRPTVPAVIVSASQELSIAVAPVQIEFISADAAGAFNLLIVTATVYLGRNISHS